jgi:hypothetical protein
MNGNDELREEGERLLREVTQGPDGKPMTISRYGWKIIQIEGRKYLAAATPDELITALANRTEPALVALREQLLRGGDFKPFCSSIGPGECQAHYNCSHCTEHYLGGGEYICTCDDF